MSPRTATLALWGLGFQLGALAARYPVAATPAVAPLRVYSLRADAVVLSHRARLLYPPSLR